MSLRQKTSKQKKSWLSKRFCLIHFIEEKTRRTFGERERAAAAAGLCRRYKRRSFLLALRLDCARKNREILCKLKWEKHNNNNKGRDDDKENGRKAIRIFGWKSPWTDCLNEERERENDSGEEDCGLITRRVQYLVQMTWTRLEERNAVCHTFGTSSWAAAGWDQDRRYFSAESADPSSAAAAAEKRTPLPIKMWRWKMNLVWYGTEHEASRHSIPPVFSLLGAHSLLLSSSFSPSFGWFHLVVRPFDWKPKRDAGPDETNRPKKLKKDNTKRRKKKKRWWWRRRPETVTYFPLSFCRSPPLALGGIPIVLHGGRASHSHHCSSIGCTVVYLLLVRNWGIRRRAYYRPPPGRKDAQLDKSDLLLYSIERIESSTQFLIEIPVLK